MSLNLDKTAWKRVTLRDVVRHVTDRVDAETSGLERFLAGEHIPSSSLSITDWGVIGRDPIGPMFYKRFKPGHVLYVSRRTYLRKVAVPEFEGITGEKTFVLETLDENLLLQEFLPYVLSAERFHAHAIAHSRGSVNPYLNWGELAAYEFDLPPLNEQQRLADLLWSIERHRRSIVSTIATALSARYTWLGASIGSLVASETVPFDRVWARSPESGWSAAPVDEATGCYVLSLAAIGQFGYRVGQLKSVPDSPEVRAAKLAKGDLLISRANTVEAVGRPCIFTEDRSDVSFPDTMMRLHLIDDVLPEFAEAVLASPHGRKHMKRSAAGSATSMVKINRQSLARLTFPKATASEQKGILDRLALFDKAAELAQADLLALSSSQGTVLAGIFGSSE
ncbi:restriction endonuclease subunit S [Kitasatospora purpeofusca]|uniref:restriction endonuclease subunit S n=1 Tax=Kitasatospora purpeofusca TaxID=67352 RepID=UPI0035D84FF5